MMQRLLEARSRREGISFDEACKKLGIWCGGFWWSGVVDGKW
jgi:hypothetical protein